MSYNNLYSFYDLHMPLVGTYYHQTGQTPWIPISAQKLDQKLSSENPPEFRTVLGIVGELKEDMHHDNYRYLGPLHFDFDASDIEESIDGFHEFLSKLIAKGVDLRMCRLFASGVKGFHIEIPMLCFMKTIPEAGIAHLPKIYHQCAHALYCTNTLDLRIYSGGKGRMWRVPNRQRSSGTFKVPLSADEALNITATTYAEMVSAPRQFPPLKPPLFCSELAQIYTKARDKFLSKALSKSKASKGNQALIAHFGSNLPPRIAALGRGEFPARGGWNQIVIQIATLALALGLSDDETVHAFKGLIQNHQSDGRYNSTSKRETELRHKYAYFKGNQIYNFSVGGIRSILPKGMPCPEFRGLEG